MKEFVMLPFVLMLITGVAMELVDIAENSSKQIVEFTQNIDLAIPCATQGIDISLCSPELVQDETVLKKNLQNYRNTLGKINASAQFE